MNPPLVALAVAGLAMLLLALSGPLYQVGLLSLTAAFALLRWAAYIGLASIGVALLTGYLSYRRRAWRGVALSLAAGIAGLICFSIPFAWQQRARGVPPIHDISTDLQNPPEFKAVLPLRADAPNSLERGDDLADQQRRGYPDIEPLTLDEPPDEAFEAALRVMQDLEWQIVDADKPSGRIEATDVTPWFGFKDDVVVRLTAWGSGTRVDMRSVSRVGRSDVGTNARRIREFLEALRE